MRGIGRDEHEVATVAARQQRRDRAPAGERRSEQVRVDLAPERFVVDRVKASGRRRAGVVDQRVDRPERLLGGCEEVLDRTRVRDVEGMGERLAARGLDLGRDLVQAVLAAGANGDLPTLRAERARDRAADTRRSACDDRGACLTHRGEGYSPTGTPPQATTGPAASTS